MKVPCSIFILTIGTWRGKAKKKSCRISSFPELYISNGNGTCGTALTDSFHQMASFTRVVKFLLGFFFNSRFFKKSLTTNSCKTTKRFSKTVQNGCRREAAGVEVATDGEYMYSNPLQLPPTPLTWCKTLCKFHINLVNIL